ncbi:MAG TPA: Clp protease N-terminal domain-containing protein [Terriglobia bacterium]|nr:Clp protease N-terminal domain-containing protein [Terriglobia bacterium]
MFERYTEKARRAVFFARYEASQFGTPHIETEHLLLGLLREDRALANRFLRSGASIETIRKQIEGRLGLGAKISTSVDLPLSLESKRVLEYAVEEAERLSNKHVGTEHLLLGLLREEKCFAAEILRERGLRLSTLREEIGRVQTGRVPANRQITASLLGELSRDLTQAALDNELEPLIEREHELESAIRTLSRRTKNNLILVGERGVGKRSLVHGIAQRIAGGRVPAQLESKRILAVDLSPTLAVTGGGERLEARVTAVLKELNEAANLIVYIEDLVIQAGGQTPLNAADLLKPLLSEGEIQCIAATTPHEWRQWKEEEAWLGQHFIAVHVKPPDEPTALNVLLAIKPRYEQFHGVVYTAEALQSAVQLSQRYIPDRYLPDKAIDLLDEAGAAVTTAASGLPQDLAEAQKQVRAAMTKMENAIAMHEFEKARTYNDEERGHRETVRRLRVKYNLNPASAVNVDDIEAVVARLTGIPIDTIREGRSPGGSGGQAGVSS